MKDEEKLKAIQEITRNIELNVDINKAVEDGMEVRLRIKTIKFGALAAVLASLVGIFVWRFSLESVFMTGAIAFAALIPVSIYMCLRKLKGGANHAD